MALLDFVNWYRAAEKPSILSGGKILGSMYLSSANVALIKKLGSENGIGRFDEISRQNSEIELDKLAPEETYIEFIYNLSTGDDANIYSDYESLLEKNKTLKKGSVVGDFYLWKSDYFSPEQQNDKRLKNLNSIGIIIKGLAELAHYHDSKKGDDTTQLVFVKDLDSLNSVSTIIQPEISLDMVEAEQVDESIFEELQLSTNNPHLAREKGVFRASVMEFLVDCSNEPKLKFEYLIFNWTTFLKLFKKNFDTYLSGFAFHKAKQEIAEAELNIAEQISKVIGENTGKLLGIPVSFAALIAMIKVDSILEQVLVAAGVLIASLIASEIVHNQASQFGRIKHAKEIKFSSIIQQKVTYSAELRTFIDDADDALNKSIDKLGNTLVMFRILSWLPAILAAFYLYVVHQNLIIKFVEHNRVTIWIVELLGKFC